jgi:hypothetical protein
VRYFTVVADHLHFGRAAAALHLAQPSLSRQIRRLEAQLGARLLDRTPQGSRLTEAGEVFLPRAKALLRSAAQAAAHARAAAEPTRITIGYTTVPSWTPSRTSSNSSPPGRPWPFRPPPRQQPPPRPHHTVPLRDVEPSHVVLATRAGDHNRLLAAFRKSAQAHLTGPGPAEPASAPPSRAEE